MHDVAVVTAFRRPSFRQAVAPSGRTAEEPWDAAPFATAGGLRAGGLDAVVLPLQNMLPAFVPTRDDSRLMELLSRYPARLLLFASDSFISSRSTASVWGMARIGAAARELNPHVRIAATGRLATVLAQDLLGVVSCLDDVVVGESDGLIAEIATQMLANRRPTDYVVDRRSIGRCLPATVPELDATALPAFDAVPMELLDAFAERRHPGAGGIPFSLRTSAGCTFACRFCAGVPEWNVYRTKSGSRVGEEIDSLRSAVGDIGRLSFLEDELFTRDLGHVRAVADELYRRSIIIDGLYTHSSLLSASTIEALRGTVRRVHLGIDSLDDRVLKALDKRQTVASVLRAVERLCVGGIDVHGEFIVGTPADTPRSTAITIAGINALLSSGLLSSAESYVFCPHPGTALSAELDPGLLLARLSDMQESGGVPTLDTPTMSRQEVFAAYLMSQVVIREAMAARASLGPTSDVGEPDLDELARVIRSTQW